MPVSHASASDPLLVRMALLSLAGAVCRSSAISPESVAHCPENSPGNSMLVNFFREYHRCSLRLPDLLCRHMKIVRRPKLFYVRPTVPPPRAATIQCFSFHIERYFSIGHCFGNMKQLPVTTCSIACLQCCSAPIKQGENGLLTSLNNRTVKVPGNS
jgi:hypothetical protein